MELLHRRTLLAHGYTDAELRQACRTGRLTRVRPGVYRTRGDAHAHPVEEHLVRIRAAAHADGPDVAVSHCSAVAMHRWPLWNSDLQRVHFTRPGSSGGRRAADRHLHAAPLQEEETTLIGGIRVTSASRTVIDISRTMPFEQAVVVGDAALREVAVSVEDLDEALARMYGWRGMPAARRAVAFIDALSESVGESRSRVLLNRIGLPKPQLQREVHSAGGLLLGRADFCIPELGVIGEFDGRVKYDRYLRPGQTPGDAVFEEKRREDALRDAGWQLVRWVWSELGEPQAILSRFERAIERGRPMPRR